MRSYQGSFITGEISPELYGRVDIQKYYSALATLKNFTTHVYGGVSRRQGTCFLGNAKYSNKKCRLIPFEYKAENGQTYAMEFGNLYIRFWTTDGVILSGSTPYEVVSPYTESELSDITWVQSADTVFIFHPSHPIQKLVRYGHSNWTLSEFVVQGGPFLDENTEDISITPTKTTGSETVTLTASSAVFTSAHVGHEFRIRQRCSERSSSSGNIQSATAVTGTLTLNNVYGEWELVTTGQGPTVSDYWSGTISVSRRYNGGSWQVIRSFEINKDRDLAISGVEDEDFADYKVEYSVATHSYTTTSGGEETTVVSQATVQLRNKSHTKIGSVRISAVTSSTVATGTETVMLGEYGTATDLWAEPAWGGDNGYPRCGTFFQDRLFVAASLGQPQTIWASKVGSYDDFGTSEELQDDDGINRTLVSRKMSEIVAFVPLDNLIVLTSGTEYKISSSNGIVSAVNFDARAQSYYGASMVPPEVVANHVFFVQRDGQDVRDLSYSWEADNYNASILSLLARHLLKNKTIVSMAWQLSPDSILWCVTSDGQLLGCTYLNDQEVISWHRHETDGNFESVCCINNSTRTDVFFSVLRNGARRIELLSDRAENVSGEAEDCFYVDSGLTYSGTPVASVSGLDHLEGKTVSILADGNVEPEQKVVSGTVSLTKMATASKITVGLKYSSELETLDIDGADGKAFGSPKKISLLKVRVLKSRGGEFGDNFTNMDSMQEHSGTQTGDCLPLVSGIKELFLPSDWRSEGHVCIRQQDPLPLNILSISPEIKIGR